MDRDGVINQEVNYLHRIDDFVFLDGVFSALEGFERLGYLLIIITNQAGIARGYYTEEEYHRLTNWMLCQFAERGIHIAKVYYSPYHPEHGQGVYKRDHPSRKPNPGMILEAQREYRLDLAQCILIGDKESDVEAGLNAGVGSNYLVMTGHPIDRKRTKADRIFPDLVSILEYIRVDK